MKLKLEFVIDFEIEVVWSLLLLILDFDNSKFIRFNFQGMDKFFIRKQNLKQPCSDEKKNGSNQSKIKQRRLNLNLDGLPSNLGLRTRISEYNPNDQDRVRKAYFAKRTLSAS